MLINLAEKYLAELKKWLKEIPPLEYSSEQAIGQRNVRSLINALNPKASYSDRKLLMAAVTVINEQISYAESRKGIGNDYIKTIQFAEGILHDFFSNALKTEQGMKSLVTFIAYYAEFVSKHTTTYSDILTGFNNTVRQVVAGLLAAIESGDKASIATFIQLHHYLEEILDKKHHRQFKTPAADLRVYLKEQCLNKPIPNAAALSVFIRIRINRPGITGAKNLTGAPGMRLDGEPFFNGSIRPEGFQHMQAAANHLSKLAQEHGDNWLYTTARVNHDEVYLFIQFVDWVERVDPDATGALSRAPGVFNSRVDRLQHFTAPTKASAAAAGGEGKVRRRAGGGAASEPCSPAIAAAARSPMGFHNQPAAEAKAEAMAKRKRAAMRARRDAENARREKIGDEAFEAEQEADRRDPYGRNVGL